MFKFIGISPSQIHKIEQIRGGQSQDRSGEFNLIGGGQPSKEFTFPHHTYTIGLDALRQGAYPQAELTGTRVIEAGQDAFNYIYDLNNTVGGSEPHMFKDQKFLKGYEDAFNSIIGSQMENEGYEVRTLKVPALHVEALWLHKEGARANDKYVPVRSIGAFEANHVYDVINFFTILTNMARSYDITDDMRGG